MPKLILESRNDEPAGEIGGKPLGTAATPWPHCTSCSGPMQFLARMPLRATEIPEFECGSNALLLFQCQNAPGMCDEWDANSGGNAALVIDDPVVELPAPPGETLLEGRWPYALRGYALDKPDEDNVYIDALSEVGSQVLGKLGGNPTWIQGDETPTCDCGAVMRFAAQLEDCGGGINFGDAGAGYAFVCVSCRQKAKFLWQCS